jgi:predicted RNase H-like nuclease (RuvC/YqgF family)
MSPQDDEAVHHALLAALREAGLVADHTGGQAAVHRVLGQLEANVGNLCERIESLERTIEKVTPRVQRVEEWREQEQARRRKVSAAQWTLGVGAITLALERAWDWLAKLVNGGGQ